MYFQRRKKHGALEIWIKKELLLLGKLCARPEVLVDWLKTLEIWNQLLMAKTQPTKKQKKVLTAKQLFDVTKIRIHYW